MMVVRDCLSPFHFEVAADEEFASHFWDFWGLFVFLAKNL